MIVKGSFVRTERLNQLLKEIALEPLSERHLPDVAKLHFKLLPWSFNGKFGEAHILALYTALMQSDGLRILRRRYLTSAQLPNNLRQPRF